EAVGAINEENALVTQQQTGQEIVRQLWRPGATVEDRQAAGGQRPGPRSREAGGEGGSNVHEL
ncbi:MAG: hypothetical protein AAB037_04920, partial [Chloroflexota bacterium]